VSVTVKICGLTTPEAVDAALDAGADMIGFVFFAKSPRHISPEAAGRLASPARGRASVVALTVDADDAALDAVMTGLAPDILQLHGHETPERAAELRSRLGVPTMKALGVAEPGDLAAIPTYAAVCDRLLIDAKPPKGGALPGGNGVAFDWRLVKGLAPGRPWLLAGGLTPQNVAQALALTGAPGVDVSSGVESTPGVKDLAKIAAFVAAAKAAG
jgi:phosphoribosylanthranilate isomerase